MIFNNKDKNKIDEIIKFQQTIFILTNIGKEVLSEDDKLFLKKYKIDTEKLKEYTPVDEMFYFGKLSAYLGENLSKEITYKEFKEFLNSKEVFPLTKEEINTLNFVKKQNYHYIKSLNEEISKDINLEIVKSERQYEILKDSLEEAIIKRQTRQELISNLGKKFNNWNINLKRIAETELQTALEEGKAITLEQEHGKDVEVYKDVFPGACFYCISAYLTDGIGSKPRIFKLSELRKNGTNIGRKAKDSKPVIGAHHPFCRCNLNLHNSEFDWDKDKRAFLIPKEYISKSKRKSKVKVTIGGIEHLV